MPKKFFYVLFLAMILLIGPVFSSAFVYQKLQKNMKIHIDGSFRPFLLLPAFRIHHAHFVWKEKVELVSGDLTVRYNPVFFLPPSLRVRIEGHRLKAKFLGGWARQAGVENLDPDYFYADLGLDREGIREIYAIEARGPKFQFRIKKSETLTSERTQSEELAA